MTLNDLSKARPATIVDFRTGHPDISRFLSKGLVPGTVIQVQRVAPLRCPLQVKAGSTLHGIRRTEAQCIQVEDAR